MIRLAMRESEYGTAVTQNGPLKREYVGACMFMYFFVESLLYLCGAGGVFAWQFLRNNLSLPKEKLMVLVGAAAVIYLCLTIIGLILVRRTALKEYRKIKRARKGYLSDIEELIRQEDDEQ